MLRNGIYDKSIIHCAFREDLRKKKFPDDNGGCEGFQPSLTTNGMCYTFNGKSTSELWKSSKMISTFDSMFPSHSKSNRVFGGSRTVQGNYILKCILISKLIKAGNFRKIYNKGSSQIVLGMMII